MDMSFLLKQFLPPGVTVEALTEQAQQIAQQVVAAVQMVRDNNRLLTENNAMLRQLVEASQQQSFNINSENNTHAIAPAQPLAVSPSADELGHGRTDHGNAGTYASAGTDTSTGRPDRSNHG